MEKVKSIVFMIVMVGMGFAIGFGAVVIAFGGGLSDTRLTLVGQFVNLLIIFAVLYVSVLLNTVLHEWGHYIGGRLSGYTFISFRVLNHIWVREGGRLVHKKYNLAGTEGQCLMMPPEGDGDYPYILYNLSGSLVNLLLSGLSFVLYIIVPTDFAFIFFILGFVSLGIGLINLTPMKISGVSNDGYNVVQLFRDKENRQVLRVLFAAQAHLTAGARYKDMPVDWSVLPPINDEDPVTYSGSVLQLNLLHDTAQYEKARELAERIIEEDADLLPLQENELRCELLFYEIIGERDPDKIKRLYTKKLKKYIQASQTHIGKHRLMYAYEKLVSQNEQKARDALAKFDKACAVYPFAGEVESEREIIAYIDTRV